MVNTHGEYGSSLTMWFESQCLEGLLDVVTLVLTHEAIVNVDGYHLARSEGSIEEGRADSTVYTATHQGLERRGEIIQEITEMTFDLPRH